MADEQEKKTFKVDLFQQARVHTETFEIEAADEDDAGRQAAKICKDKGLKKGFDVEVSLVTYPEPVEEPQGEDSVEPLSEEDK